jgi:hypothetical protein
MKRISHSDTRTGIRGRINAIIEQHLTAVQYPAFCVEEKRKVCLKRKKRKDGIFHEASRTCKTTRDRERLGKRREEENSSTLRAKASRIPLLLAAYPPLTTVNGMENVGEIFCDRPDSRHANQQAIACCKPRNVGAGGREKNIPLGAADAGRPGMTRGRRRGRRPCRRPRTEGAAPLPSWVEERR